MSEKNVIKIIRVYDASLKTVWDAWADSDKIAQWWGPRGFTITTHAKDLKTGGSWNYTMHGPDETDYPNKTQYLVVEENSKLVYDHGANDDRPPMFRVTVLFSEIRGKTMMEMGMEFPSPEAAEEARKFIKLAGGDATWDRLAEFLIKESTSKDKFVINRAFNVTVQQMFELWTKPEVFSKWFSPKGTEMKFIHSEIKPGGEAFYMMQAGEMKMYGRVNYLKIEAPGTLVYTQQFCDENENISRHPMAPLLPETMLTNVKFVKQPNELTLVTVTWEPYGAVTSEELKVFVDSRAGMTMGWTGSFDKLDQYISES